MSMKFSEFILLIFNCKKYRYKALKQKKTWLNNFKIMPFFHVIGDIQLTSDYVFYENENILYVKVEDDYKSLPKKVIAAYEAIQKEYIFNYIFKTDDDQNLLQLQFIDIIKNILIKSSPKIHYGGEIINVDKPYLSQYHNIHPELPQYLPVLQTQYCSGRFYVLSDLAVQQLISKKDLICKEYLEDYAIGYHLDPVLKKTIFYIQSNKFFVDFKEFT
jgi:hypothetical protein